MCRISAWRRVGNGHSRPPALRDGRTGGIQPQPVLGKPVQEAEVPAPAPGGLRLDSTRIRKLDGTRSLTGREKTPHPALPRLRDRHPLPGGEGARRRRAGEGLLGRSSKARVKQFSGALFCSWTGLVEATSAQRIEGVKKLKKLLTSYTAMICCFRPVPEGGQAWVISPPSK